MFSKTKMRNTLDGRTAYLRETLVECGRGHTWKAKLALVDDCGQWMCSIYWNLNQGNTKAVPILKQLGWKIVA